MLVVFFLKKNSLFIEQKIFSFVQMQLRSLQRNQFLLIGPPNLENILVTDLEWNIETIMITSPIESKIICLRELSPSKKRFRIGSNNKILFY